MLKIFPRTFVNPLFLGVLFIGFLVSLSYLGDMAGMSFIQRLHDGDVVLKGVQLFIVVGWILLYLSAVSFLIALYVGIREFFSPKGSKEFFRWGGIAALFTGFLLWYPVVIITGLIFMVLLYLGMSAPGAPLVTVNLISTWVHSLLYGLSVSALVILSIKGGMFSLFGTAFWGTVFWGVSFGFFLICNEG